MSQLHDALKNNTHTHNKRNRNKWCEALVCFGDGLSNDMRGINLTNLMIFYSCQVRSDASLFLTELIEEAVKLGIEWPSSLEPGMIEEPTQ